MGILNFFDRRRLSSPLTNSAFVETISLDDRGSVVVEDRGEHHMGASTIVVTLPFELGGTHEFFTTNGTAFYFAAAKSLFIHDACVLLQVHLDCLTVSHWMPQHGSLIQSATPNGESLLVKTYEPVSRRDGREVSVNFEEFSIGFGKVRNGRFPSAYP